MSDTPRVRGGLLVRGSVLVIGLALFAAGIVALLESRLGLSPWDVLHQGISRHTPLIVRRGEHRSQRRRADGRVAARRACRGGHGRERRPRRQPGAALQLARRRRAARARSAGRPHRSARRRARPDGSRNRALSRRGARGRPARLLDGGRTTRRTRFRIGVVRGALELSALAAGVVLGGTFGVGTIAFALGIGPAVELSFWLLAHSPLGRRPRPTPARVRPPRSRPCRAARRSVPRSPGEAHRSPTGGRGGWSRRAPPHRRIR